MANTVVVVGTQWGDEGKGKITDFLGEQAHAIVRYQGGDNAGHTIKANNQTFALRLIPSGILHEKSISVIGNGVVINPKSLAQEIQYLKDKGVQKFNLRISNRAHLIMPYHILLDQLQEESKGDEKIGTTNRGIGPAYMDKASRVGIRVADLLEYDVFEKALKRNVEEKNEIFEKVYHHEGLNYKDFLDEFYEYGQQIKDLVCDTSLVLNDLIDDNKNVLFEGAQGIMLDLDQGTYPFVTSSNPAGGVTVGAGVGATKIDAVVGVAKAYTSRVGDGPFTTELHGSIAEQIREEGHEYGTVTSRPRRVGWLDLVILKHSIRAAGITSLSLNLLDVLTGHDTLKVCVAYELDGKRINYYPAGIKELNRCKPIYVELPGWKEDISQITTYKELPKNAQNYLNFISDETKVPISVFSVGPNRTQTIVLNDVWED